MNVTGRDGVLESIHEIRSLEVNCRAEGVSRIMNRQLLQMCGSAGGLFCKQWEILLSTRSVHGYGLRMRFDLRISEQRKQRAVIGHSL